MKPHFMFVPRDFIRGRTDLRPHRGRERGPAEGSGARCPAAARHPRAPRCVTL